MFGNALVAMQGGSINRGAIVYCLRDIRDYICFSQYNDFRSHVSVSSAQNTSAERALLSPARYRARVSQARLSRARVPFIFVGAFASEICKKVIRVHHSSSHARRGSSRETEEEEATRNHPGFSKGKKRRSIVPSLSDCADKRFRSRIKAQ